MAGLVSVLAVTSSAGTTAVFEGRLVIHLLRPGPSAGDSAGPV
jgi:hypothetical protein